MVSCRFLPKRPPQSLGGAQDLVSCAGRRGVLFPATPVAADRYDRSPMPDTESAPRSAPGAGTASRSPAAASRAPPSGSGFRPARPSGAAGGRRELSMRGKSGLRHPKRSQAVPAGRTSRRARPCPDRTRQTVSPSCAARRCKLTSSSSAAASEKALACIRSNRQDSKSEPLPSRCATTPFLAYVSFSGSPCSVRHECE